MLPILSEHRKFADCPENLVALDAHVLQQSSHTPSSAKAYEELDTVTVTSFDTDETAKLHNAICAKFAAIGANAAIITDEGNSQGATRG